MNKLIYPLSIISAIAAITISCNKNNPEGGLTPEEKAEAAAMDKLNVCQSVLRPLAGLDELADGWESKQFEPAIGVVTDEAKPTERSLIVSNYEGAEQFFLSITTDDHTVGSGNGWTWSYEGVGSMTLTKVGSADCYAYADVALVQMPDLTRINFVPETAVGDNAKFDGTPYYGAGDVMMDKDGVYWICVRPSSGPLRKEYAYFVSFTLDAKKNFKTQKQDIYKVDASTGRKTKDKAGTSGNWIYGTSLVEERIAIAAAHTFYAIAFGESEAERFINEKLDGKNLDINKMMSKKLSFAYGSPLSISNSNVQAKYLQPAFVYSEMELGGKRNETIQKAFPEYQKNNCSLQYSLTVPYDPSMQLYFKGKIDDSIFEDGSYPYDVNRFLLKWTPDETSYPFFAGTAVVLRQKKVTDKGKKSSDFVETIWQCPVDKRWDYWGSLAKTQRTIISKGDDQNGGKVLSGDAIYD